MKHTLLCKSHKKEIAALFSSVFTASEGESEGTLICNLASNLSDHIDNKDICCFGTYLQESLIAAIFFTRLDFKEPVCIYMLAPVAVSTSHQGKGVGQSLINHGLEQMKQFSVAVVVTYGDPAFYKKTGFRPLPENILQAPLKLSMPQGWLGLSLTGQPIPTIRQRPTCVKQFNDPAYW